MPFCPNCGVSLQPNQNFCPNCGQRLNQTQPQAPPQQYPPPPPPQPYYQAPPQAYPPPPVAGYAQAPPQQGERVVAVVPTLKKMKFMGQWDLYAMVATESRAIFAHITKDMVNQAVKDAQEKAKAEGKGFFGQWGAQLNTSFFYTQKYRQMSPEAVMREQPDNFAINLGDVRKVNVWQRTSSDKKAILKQLYWEVEFESSRGKEKYTVDDGDPNPALDAAFGSKVNHPFL